jgi:uncharacterized membrane protein YdjX (TVP38/TMEM64 family)
MSDIDDIDALFETYKGYSILIYIAAQIFQIVICVVPGQMLQFAAGYAFGFWLGLLFSLIGAAVGAVIAYYLAKLLGQGILYLIFDENQMDNFVEKLNSKKAIIAVFAIYLIPGLPKDACSYAAGISNMKLKPFLIVSLIGRTPAMAGSLLIGNQVETGSYTLAIAIAAMAVILFVLGIVFRNRISDILNQTYDRLYK